MSHALMNNYPARLDVAFARGEGPWLWDEQGRRYLDAFGGIAVCGLGHAHPAVTKALCEQAGALMHTTNVFRIPKQEILGERLCTLAGMDKAFFCNSGAEANEAAIKLARLYGHAQGIDTPAIVVMEGSFHGRTLATLTATGNRKIQKGFEPLVQGFARAPYNDLAALEKIAEHSPNVVAVLVEPVTGEGGVHVPDEDYLKGIRALCDRHGWLMMLDEIQTGMGRTGAWFAFQHTDIQPDVMTLAKALGNGMPIGACLARGAAAETFTPGSHGTTFGGNPLACAAALAVVETLAQDDLIDKARKQGVYLLEGFKTRLADVAGIKDIRGKGLMIGIELERDCPVLVKRALEQSLLINVTAGNVVRLLPPLIIDQAEADEILDKVSALIREFCAE